MSQPINPLAQKLSDQMMMARYAALYLKDCILEAQTTMLELQNDIMDDPGSKMMAMETGDIEREMLELAGVHGRVKALHMMLNTMGRKHNVAMPAAPNYSDEYLALAGQSVAVKLSSVARR